MWPASLWQVDTCETSEGLDPEEVQNYVAQLVTRQLGGGAGGSGFSLPPEQVLLLSARNALLARQVLAGRSGPDATKRFCRLAFGVMGGGMAGRGGPSQEQVRHPAPPTCFCAVVCCWSRSVVWSSRAVVAPWW